MTSLNIESWSPSDVAQWIKGLGPQFESSSENFLDEEITGKALLTINAEYLNELSIEDVNDQNIILEAVHCLIEVDSCLKGETVHSQVLAVNEQTKALIEKLEKESHDASEGDVTTCEDSTKFAGRVYQLAKKLLSWLVRSPFSEMNACWPLKDSVTRVVRDMTDETLLQNRQHLLENLKKLQISFDVFLDDEQLHEVFKQPPILVNEEFTLEGEGLGIGIKTSQHILTVNSVNAESPAGNNGNIKNGDEIVNVNGQCVIAWPQKTAISLMKSKTDSVSLTLKKLPPVKGPLNKPLDKPGTPLSEMNVVMDRSKVAPERPPRVEMKEAGIKEETSLEMQAIENENEAEEDSKVESRIEGIKEEDEGKQVEKENEKSEIENAERVDEKENVTVVCQKTEENEEETSAKKDETKAKCESQEEESEGKECGLKENDDTEKEKGDEKKVEEVVENADEKELNENVTEEGMVVSAAVVGETEKKAAVVEDSDKTKEMPSEEEKDTVKVEVNGDVKGEVKDLVKTEEDNKEDENVVNGEASVKTPEMSEIIEAKKTEESSESKSKTDTSEVNVEIKVESPSPKKEIAEASVVENGQNGSSAKKEPVSPSKKPARPAAPKMKIGSVKNVTVGGTSAKQVEVYGTSKVVRREKKIDGAPNKRISCIELGEADCEGWLTKRSGGHGLTPTRWRRQWCVLKEEHLYYYKTSFDREAGGVIDITGYNMSTAPEIKKSFAFKCEKEGAKKYFFHADNEVDRESWIKTLNLASRGERKQKEIGAGLINEPSDHKSVSALKTAQSNRPRTGSVLAGIRFNYYDDDDMEENRKIDHESSAAQRVNEAIVNGQNDHTKDESSDDQNILKSAAGVEEDESQVAPVEDVKDDEKTELNDKDSSGEPKTEPEEKISEGETAATSVDNADDKEQSKDTREDKKDEVSKIVDAEAAVNGDSKDEEGTQEAISEAKEVDDGCSEEMVPEDSAGGTKETLVEDENTKISEQRGTDEDVAKISVTVNTEDTCTKSENDVTESSDTAVKPEEDTTESEDVTTKSEEDITKSEGGATEADEVDVIMSNDTTTKHEESAVKSDGEMTIPEEETKKSEGDAVMAGDDVTKTENTTAKVEGERCEEKAKDDFEEVVESIKEAEIAIDGTEKSPEMLLRRLSINSQTEIMDKFVKLRVLKQILKDKEESMDAIDELLSSHVTPESVAEWRAKYETVANSNTNSNDLNENSQS